MSALFTLFAPLPLLLFRCRSWSQGFPLLFLALLTNVGLVGVLSGWGNAALFAFFVGGVSVLFPYFYMQKSWAPDRSILLTVMGLVAMGGVGVLAYAADAGMSPEAWVHVQVDEALQLMKQMGTLKETAEFPLEVVKATLLREMISAGVIATLFFVWVNVMALFRVNPNRLLEKGGYSWSYFRQWKSPEWLVWPTLMAGATFITDLGVVTTVGVNVFKILMAIYALQGLSILSFYFDAFRLRSFVRVLVVGLTAVLAMPLLLALGFFDLWFDFRSKIRQS